MGLDGAVGEAGKDIVKVFADWQAEPAAALDYREDGGDLGPCLLAAQMQPVFPFMPLFT